MNFCLPFTTADAQTDRSGTEMPPKTIVYIPFVEHFDRRKFIRGVTQVHAQITAFDPIYFENYVQLKQCYIKA